MFTILIPAYNEEKTVRKVLKMAAKVPKVGQILVIDDGSSDRTAERCKDISSKIEVISHRTNMGKGAAVRTGITHAKHECVVFIDADLVNMTPDKVYMLAEPILEGRADFVKASFLRARGRVTEIAVKPMMQILFPDMYFDQPISGQFAARLSFLRKIKIVENWGLDIGILLDAVSRGLKIEEVFIGELEHKAQSEHSLAKMSEQVMHTMIQKAGLLSNMYKLVVFSFDEALIKNYSIKEMMKFLGKEAEYNEISRDLADKDILPIEYYKQLAALMADVHVDQVKKYVDTLELRTYAKDIVSHLRRRRYNVGIVCMHFSPTVREIARQLDIQIVESLGLKVQGKKFTGELTRTSTLEWFAGTMQQGYLSGLHRAAEQAGTDLESTIVVAASREAIPMIRSAGLGVAYRAKDKEVRKAAEKTISILPELLMLVE